MKLQKQTYHIYYNFHKLHKLILSSLHFSPSFVSIILSILFFICIITYFLLLSNPYVFLLHFLSSFSNAYIKLGQDFLQLLVAEISSSAYLLVLMSSLQ